VIPHFSYNPWKGLATAVGFVMFADLPDAVTWLGILVIVASGVYIAIAGRPIKLPLLARSRTPSA
jgi:hypothetical protein